MTAPAEPAPIAPPKRHFPLRRVLLVALGLLIVAVLVARTLFLEAFKIIPQAGMAPTLAAGDHIFVRKDAYGIAKHGLPARGDIIVFRYPDHPERYLVKRVIGLPGDIIAVQDGALFINGWRIPTCVAGVADVDIGDTTRAGFAVVELLGDTAYLVFRDPPKHGHGEESEEQQHAASEGPFTVANNEVFVLGDNREHSQDSRSSFEGRGGGVPVDQIKGRASRVWMSERQKGHLAWGKTDLTAAPKCPEGFPEATCSGLERCLSNRPPREQTTPPENPSAGAASPR